MYKAANHPHTLNHYSVFTAAGSILSSFHAQGTRKYSHRKSSSFCVLWTVLASSLKETHTKPFSCTDFEVKFAQPVNLTGEKPFSCPYCEAKFSLSDSLKTHLYTHTEEKRFLALTVKPSLLFLGVLSNTCASILGRNPTLGLIVTALLEPHLLYAHSPDWPSPGMKLPCHSLHQHAD